MDVTYSAGQQSTQLSPDQGMFMMVLFFIMVVLIIGYSIYRTKYDVQRNMLIANDVDKGLDVLQNYLNKN
jgi:hypothetical protein